MGKNQYAVSSEINAEQVVLSCIGALNEEDYTTARSYVNDNMVFEGVLGSRNGADAYFKDMEHMKLHYTVKKAFVNGDDVCLLCDLDMQGTNIFCCSWYHVEGGKISSLKVVFDPRPVLEKSGKSSSN